MDIAKLSAKTGSCLFISGEFAKNLSATSKASKLVLITDKKIRSLYKKQLSKFKVIEIDVGEKAKNLQTVNRIYKKFLEMELDRSSFVVGVGGGVVCDVTGFAASTYLRGIRFGFVPTTLLAQVDASAGGKNGVDFEGYKNLIGTIKQPEFCILDFDFLKTLPRSELASGFAEIVKCGAIANAELFEYLEKNYREAFSLKPDAIQRVTIDALKVKIKAVEADESEQGERMKLNFGHTFGHAIEKTNKISHGEAISIGMAIAAEISVSKGLLSKVESKRLTSLLNMFGLPTNFSSNKKKVFDALRKDKKRRGDSVNMILLERIGKAVIKKISLDELEETLVKF